MVMEGDLTWGVEHTVQYTDDTLQNYTPETYTILLTNATPIHSIKKKGKKAMVDINKIRVIVEKMTWVSFGKLAPNQCVSSCKKAINFMEFSFSH